MGPVNITIIRGDTRNLPLIFSKNSVPVDITGWTIILSIKDGKEEILKRDITSHIDPTNGKSLIQLIRQETASFNKNKYNYSICILTNTDEFYTVLYGVFNIKSI